MKIHWISTGLAASCVSACVATTPIESGTDTVEVAQLSQEVTGPQALHIGTQSNTESATGVTFAADLTDIPNVNLKGDWMVRMVQFETDYTTGESKIIVTNETVNVPSELWTLEGGITFRGEALNMVSPDPTTYARDMLSDGQIASIYLTDFGDWVYSIGLFSYSANSSYGFDRDAQFIIGWETKPEDMPGTAGSTTYQGLIYGGANILDSLGQVTEQGVVISGNATFDVGFMNQEIAGSINYDVLSFATGSAAIIDSAEITLDTADITGNGFSTTASTVVGCLTCTSASEVGGAFYGPSGENLAGLIALDVTDPTGVQEERLIGAASFVTSEPVATP